MFRPFKAGRKLSLRFSPLQPFVLLAITLLVFSSSLNTGWGQNAEPVVLDVAWNPDGNLLATIDDGGTLSVVQSAQSIPIFQFTRAAALFDAALAWNPDGSLLAAGIGNQVYILEKTSWQLTQQYTAGDPDGFVLLESAYEEIPDAIASITWGLDSRYIVSGSIDYLTTVWDNQQAQIVYQENDPSAGGPGRVWLEGGWMSDGLTKLNAFTGEWTINRDWDRNFTSGGATNATDMSPDHQQIAWGSVFGYLVIWDLHTLSGVQVLEIAESDPPTPRRPLMDIAWDATGDFVAAVSHDGEVYIANLASGEVATVLNVDGQLNAVDWNPRATEITYAGVSSTGETILATVDVNGIAGVQP